MSADAVVVHPEAKAAAAAAVGPKKSVLVAYWRKGLWCRSCCGCWVCLPCGGEAIHKIIEVPPIASYDELATAIVAAFRGDIPVHQITHQMIIFPPCHPNHPLRVVNSPFSVSGQLCVMFE